jgi:hypothetical protein
VKKKFKAFIIKHLERWLWALYDKPGLDIPESWDKAKGDFRILLTCDGKGEQAKREALKRIIVTTRARAAENVLY